MEPARPTGPKHLFSQSLPLRKDRPSAAKNHRLGAGFHAFVARGNLVRVCSRSDHPVVFDPICPAQLSVHYQSHSGPHFMVLESPSRLNPCRPMDGIIAFEERHEMRCWILKLRGSLCCIGSHPLCIQNELGDRCLVPTNRIITRTQHRNFPAMVG